MKAHGRRYLAAGAVIAAAALAACGGGNSGSSGTSSSVGTVDTAAVEKSIQQELSTTQVQVTKVDCPSDVEKQKGATFTCTVAMSNGAGGKVEVTQKGASHYTYASVPGSVNVPGTVAESQIEAELAKQGAPNATVNCPDNIVVKVGTTVTCDVSSPSGTTGKVTFGWSSADGTVDPSTVNTT